VSRTAQTPAEGEALAIPRTEAWPVPGIRLIVLVVLCAAVAIAASGCGGSSKPAVCGKRDDLTKSVDSLINVNPVSDGLSEVQSRLADVQAKTTALAQAAGDQFGPQVKALKASTAKVADDVKALSGSDKAAALGDLANDVPAVKTAYDNLIQAVGTVCD
jgi:hypothetical protein